MGPGRYYVLTLLGEWCPEYGWEMLDQEDSGQSFNLAGAIDHALEHIDEIEDRIASSLPDAHSSYHEMFAVQVMTIADNDCVMAWHRPNLESREFERSQIRGKDRADR